MNWFVIGNAVLYLAAGVLSIEKAHYTWALVWFAYGLSCFALAVLEAKGTV